MCMPAFAMFERYKRVCKPSSKPVAAQQFPSTLVKFYNKKLLLSSRTLISFIWRFTLVLRMRYVISATVRVIFLQKFSQHAQICQSWFMSSLTDGLSTVTKQKNNFLIFIFSIATNPGHVCYTWYRFLRIEDWYFFLFGYDIILLIMILLML